MHDEWLRLSRAELDGAFGDAAAPAMPAGEWRGTLIVPIPGIARAIAAAIRALVWRGKVFAPPAAVVNRVTPFGVRLVRGEVYPDPSRMDGEPALVIDYSRTSLIARRIRDEMREVAPGVLLGKVWWRGIAVCYFVLTRKA